VNGALLSCYTASLATYMERQGIDHVLAIGTQLFTGVRVDPEGPVRVRLLHQHSPLLGDRPTYSLHLARRECASPSAAARLIAAEGARSGVVVVCGDAFNLPWLVSGGRRHAPHWFVVHHVDTGRGTCRVTDPFEFVNEDGTQEPYAGELRLELLERLAAAPSGCSAAAAARTSAALGIIETAAPAEGCAWFEATRPAVSREVGEWGVLGLLRETVAFHTGRSRRSDLGSGWVPGVDGVRALADCCDRFAEDPVLYDAADDLWVAGRGRALFGVALRRAGELAGRRHELDELAAWSDEQLVPRWAALPRIFRYNAALLRRGRRPSPLPGATLRELASLEGRLMARVDELLSAEDAA
jgi:hypothetical protein